MEAAHFWKRGLKYPQEISKINSLCLFICHFDFKTIIAFDGHYVDNSTVWEQMPQKLLINLSLLVGWEFILGKLIAFWSAPWAQTTCSTKKEAIPVWNLCFPFLPQRHFSVFALSFPGSEALSTIYSVILSQHLKRGNFSGPVQKSSQQLIHLALGLHQKAAATFLPTAIKFHYIFNLRDFSNIFQVSAAAFVLGTWRLTKGSMWSLWVCNPLLVPA